MNIWNEKLNHAQALPDVRGIPSFLPLFVVKYLGPFTKSFLVITVLDTIHAVVLFASTLLVTDVLNDLADKQSVSLYGGFLEKFVLLYAISLLLSWVIRKYGYSLANVFSKYLSYRLYKTTLLMNFSKLSGFSKERLYSMFSFITKNVEDYISERWVWGLTHDIVTITLTIWIIGSRNLHILLFDLGFFSLFIFVGVILTKRSQMYSQREYKSDVEANTLATNFFMNLNSVKRLFLQNYSERILKENYTTNYKDIHKRASFYSNYWLLQDVIYGIAFLTTMGFFVGRAARGEVPVGYIVLLFSTILQIKDIFEVLVEDLLRYNDFSARMKELKSTLSDFINPKSSDTKKILTSFTRIVFEEVGFDLITPKNTKKSIFIDSLEIKPFEKIGITGPSGCGKSTLLNMLIKQVKPHRGEILVDEMDIENVLIDSTFCSMVAQPDVLFNLSIKENITLGEVFDEERYQTILEGVKAVDFINQLPNGDESILGDTNTILSQGQEQRIRIARGLYKKSMLYLLDEPFGGLDYSVKKSVMAFVFNYLKDKGVVLVSHNKDELEGMDRNYTFDRNGKLTLMEVNAEDQVALIPQPLVQS